MSSARARRCAGARTEGHATLLVGFLACGCAVEEPDDAGERVGAARSAITVAEAIDAGCSTLSVQGLSLQIIAQANCIEPDAFVEVPPQPNLTFAATVFPYLEAPARDALVTALGQNAGQNMTINSMLRTVAQQVLLYEWYQSGTCGISLAATPGSSNHETGLALDVSEYQTWRPILEQHGFSWLGSSDPVHFDYTGPGSVNHLGLDVLAFQMLWNLNHPEDPIDEDGAYGPQTEARILASPAEGFPIPPSCGAAPDVWITATYETAFDRFADGSSAAVPDTFEGDAIPWVVTIENRGDAVAEGVILALEADERLAGGEYTVSAGSPPAAIDSGAFSGSSAEVDLGAMQPGGVVTVEVAAVATTYSVDRPAPVALRAFAKRVEGHYDQATFGGAVTHDGTQTMGGGRIEVESPLDVYSRTRWEFESDRREGFTGTPAPAAQGSVLAFGAAPDAHALSPLVELQGSTETLVTLRASVTGAAWLVVLPDPASGVEGGARAPLDLPADGALHEITVTADAYPPLAGPIARIALVAPEGGAIDYLRVSGAAGPGDPSPYDPPSEEAEGSCECSAVGLEAPRRAPWSVLAAAAAALAVRRRRRVAAVSAA